MTSIKTVLAAAAAEYSKHAPVVEAYAKRYALDPTAERAAEFAIKQARANEAARMAAFHSTDGDENGITPEMHAVLTKVYGYGFPESCLPPGWKVERVRCWGQPKSGSQPCRLGAKFSSQENWEDMVVRA